MRQKKCKRCGSNEKKLYLGHPNVHGKKLTCQECWTSLDTRSRGENPFYKSEIIIQKNIRGYLTRKKLVSLKDGMTIIQKNIRGYLTRKKIISLKDGMTLDNVIELINGYNQVLRVQKKVNLSLTKKKIRKTNYPSEITENIAKFAIAKKYKIMGNWDIKPGDLTVLKKQIEVKGGFIEHGPPTFGPDEKWDWIYFVDCEETFKMKYKVYEIKKSNIYFHNLMVNNTETFGNQCIQRRRPRLVFSSIKEQLGENVKLIFDGHITELK